ncbi:hypothetical protein E3N88_32498 [Mikania micrantha]|uniref:Selenoprotein F n=1 Tax=Mikania micrantha TaxID=192012 RepID=A0A5N6MB90_9ASTR|nr:hypothetical protein E3N88_32498 [Mikania micrantha]
MVSMVTIDRPLKMWKLIYAVLLIFVCSKAEQLSSKECEDLGFTGLALCSDCNALAEYVKDQGSVPIRVIIIYSGAILEVCMRKLVFYPEIVSFIEDEKEKFSSIKVQYAFNAPPKLIMLDDAGQHKETISFDLHTPEQFTTIHQSELISDLIGDVEVNRRPKSVVNKTATSPFRYSIGSGLLTADGPQNRQLEA